MIPSWRFSISIACIGLWFLAGLIPPVAAEDWPQWRGPRSDSSWYGPELPEKWPEGGLKAAWTKPVGGGYGGIAVSGSRLYVMDRQKGPPEVERVLCFDTETGDEIWNMTYPVQYKNLDYGNGPRATPTVYDGKVYSFGALGHAYCLDAENGKSLWSKDPQVDYRVKLPEWGLAASPVIFDQFVVLHPGAEPDGCLIAFDRITGKEVWRSGKDPAGYCTPILADTPSGTQLILWSPEHILGFDPRTGHQNWNVPYKVTYGVSIATPIYQEGLVFVGGYWEGSKAIRLGKTASEANLEWSESKNLRGLMSPPLYRQGLVYLLDKQYGLTCFELATGKKLWDDKNTLTPRGRNPQASLVWLDREPVNADKSGNAQSDRVIALNSEGELILARLTRDGYRESARTKIIEPTWAHPAFAGNRVFARNDTTLVCVELCPK
ncbi:MAG: hypothetical protein JWM11_5554 [Planctomycetaceae bacterium]|nr:hypothetical protein [Planctomycetaceae bacterium]